MADTDEGTTTPENQDEGTESDQDEDTTLGEAGQKALAKEREARKAAEKALKDAQQKVKDFEDRDKTEAQKAADRIAELEKALADRDTALQTKEIETLRVKVANREGKQVPVESVTGSTEEEMIASADRLLAWRGTNGTKANHRQTGMRSGAGNPPDGSSDKEKAAAAIRAMRAGL